MLTAGLPPWQEEYVRKEIDELAARDDEYPLPSGTRFNEYVIQTQGLTILNPDAGIPGSLFVLGCSPWPTGKEELSRPTHFGGVECSFVTEV